MDDGAVPTAQLQLMKLTRRVEAVQHWRDHTTFPAVVPVAIERAWIGATTTSAAILDPRLAWVNILNAAAIPSLADLETLLTELHNLLDTQAERTRQIRRQLWNEWVQTSWHRKPKELYRYTGGTQRSTLTLLQKSDGNLTADPIELDQLLQDAWLPVFRLYDSLAEPTWEAFQQRFQRYIHCSPPVTLHRLTAKDLRATLQKQHT
jgi:hypothetical protein